MPWGTLWGSSPAAASGYVSLLVPMIKYYPDTLTVTSGTNNQIAFGAGGAPLTAIVASGTQSWGGIAALVERALKAADTAGSYTVTYDHSTQKFTLTKSAGTFTLDVGGVTADLLPQLGFTSDKSGALTYTSDVAVPAISTLTFTQRVREPKLDDDPKAEETIVESGRSEGVYYGTSDLLTFYLEVETPATAKAARTFYDSCAKRRRSFQFYPDSVDTTKYFDAFLVVKSWGEFCREMLEEKFYRLFRFDFALRFKVPSGASTIVPADLLDRRPSS